MSAQNGPGGPGPNQPGPQRHQPPQEQDPRNPNVPSAPRPQVPQPGPQGQVPPQQPRPPQQPQPQRPQNNDRFRPRPQGPQPAGPAQPRPGGQAAQPVPGPQQATIPSQQASAPRPPMPAPGQPVMQGQPMPAAQGQPMPPQGGPMPAPGQPVMPGQPMMQGPPVQARVYAQPRFAPTVTQEMRVRAGMQAPQQVVTETPWTGAVRRSQPETEPDSTGNIIRLVAALVVFVVLLAGLAGLVIVGGIFLGASLFTLIGLSAIPLVAIIAYVLWLDRWKPQPKLLLGICLLWGAVAAVVLTLGLTLVGDVALYMVGIQGMPSILGAVVQAPFLEESTKTVLLLIIVLAARRHFEGPLDGLVYGSLIGAGFAFTENVLYLSGPMLEGQSETLKALFLARCIGSPLLHTAFSTCAGVSIGFAARKWPWWSLILMWLPGLILGMALHAFWNASMTLFALMGPTVQMFGLIAVSVIVSAAWITLGLLLRRSERMHTQNMLGDYANSGWLTHAEVDMLGTWKGRKNGRSWAKSVNGGKEEMSTMIRTSGKLSTTRMRVLAGIGGDEERKVERAELQRFADARGRLLAAAGTGR